MQPAQEMDASAMSIDEARAKAAMIRLLDLRCGTCRHGRFGATARYSFVVGLCMNEAGEAGLIKISQLPCDLYEPRS
jgi:hypothetical protein